VSSIRDRDEDYVELSCSLDSIKKIYWALFRQLRSQAVSREFDDFDDDDLLLTLQVYLQRKAREAGVDATLHSEWERFLGVEGRQACSTSNKTI